MNDDEISLEAVNRGLARIAAAAEQAEPSAASLAVARAALVDIARLNGLGADKAAAPVTGEVVDQPMSEAEWAVRFGGKG